MTPARPRHPRREAAATAGRDEAATELRMGAAPDLESVRRVAERGATRIHFSFAEPDLDEAKRELERIANEVIERFWPAAALAAPRHAPTRVGGAVQSRHWLCFARNGVR